MTGIRKNKYFLLVLIILFCLAFCLDILLGSVKIPFGEIEKIISGSAGSNPVWRTIIIEFRLPKAITALLAGSALSVCGLLMQTFFRNPLADPFVLGVSSGASFGVALVILTAGTLGVNLFYMGSFLNKVGITAAAGIGSGIVLLLITLVSRRISNNVTLLIIGLMVGYIIGSLESILKYFSTPENLQGYVIWGMGNFGNVLWSDLIILFPLILVSLTAAFLLSKPLNLLLMGENYAVSMGANIKVLRFVIIVTGGILGGVVTAFCGPIAFVGIAVPHITKLFLNENDHKILIPFVALIGSILMLFCDIISQLPGYEQTIPINAVTSLVGAPIVIWVIFRQRKIKHSLASE
jgi:iron complex transport system permease protein